MASDTQPAPVSRAMFWTGHVVSGLPTLVLFASGIMKVVVHFTQPEGFEKGFTDIGWSPSMALTLGIIELVSTILYVFPRTAILGAVLLTGYMGGAIASHVRLFEPVYGHIVIGLMIWGGLYLRDTRVRAILPWRN